MNLKPLTVLLLSFIALSAVPAAAMEWDSIWSDTVRDYEVIEKITNLESIINWTTGRVLTEMSVNVRYNDPNIGRQFHDYSTMMRDSLRSRLIEALGYLRIDSIFLLKDYYSRRDYMRYEIIANVDHAFYYPPIVNRNRFYGAIALDFYGENGLANLFFRNINRAPLKKYVQPVETEDTEYYDGLIVDMYLFARFQPSMFFRIYDQDGILLYGPETVDPQALKARGVCLFTSDLDYAFRSPRVGKNLFYIMPLTTRGNMNTEIVIHDEDAARLFANPKTVETLNQSRVVVITPKPE